jgi:DNA-binding beta-propeller fold protein YncE
MNKENKVGDAHLGTRIGAPEGFRRTGLALLIAAALSACFGLFTSSADAAPEASTTYTPVGSTGGRGTAGGEFGEKLTQLAVEPTTGNLLVADPENGRLQVFSPGPEGLPTYLENLGSGILVNPTGVAVDHSTGAIYVSDSGAGKVFRFTSDGAATPTYTDDPSFVSPALSSYASQIAVDPSSHGLLVADTGDNEIRRFAVSDGHEISAFDGSTSPEGAFTALRGVAVVPVVRST